MFLTSENVTYLAFGGGVQCIYTAHLLQNGITVRARLCASQEFLECPCVTHSLHINSLVARTGQSTLILQSRHVGEGMFFSLTLS